MFSLQNNSKKKRLLRYAKVILKPRSTQHVPDLEYALTLVFIAIGFTAGLWFCRREPFIFGICLTCICVLTGLFVEFTIRRGRFSYHTLAQRLGWYIYPLAMVVSTIILYEYKPSYLFYIQIIWILMLFFYNGFRIRSQFLLLALSLNVLSVLLIAMILPSRFFDKFIYLFIGLSVLIIAEIQRRVFRDISGENRRRINQVEINSLFEMEHTQREIIFKFSEIAESRSRETGNHVRRVAEYSRILAIASGMEPRKADLLTAVSPMHDIGKLGIPESILAKPTFLSDEERQMMERHTTIGYEMLKSSSREVFTSAAIIAHQHHEKFNGEGYPSRLKGQDIHIFGRITALADVFDALASDRCYKKSWPLEKVLELFRTERGNHFDPALVDVFFNQLDHIKLIRDRWIDRVN